MAPLVVNADITHGLASDFQDMTTQGWSGGAAPANTAGGQGGPDDFFLEIFGGGNVATYNLRPEYSGVLDGSVLTLEVDLRRQSAVSGGTALEMRIVLFGPTTADRWTSSVSQTVPADDTWRTYVFSVLEADLTQVSGTYYLCGSGRQRGPDHAAT